MENLYYTAPSEEVFNEVKEQAIAIWKTYDDTYGYRSEKVNRVKELRNIGDNVMYIVAMFDLPNQAKLAARLSEEARIAIHERLEAGGSKPEWVVF